MFSYKLILLKQKCIGKNQSFIKELIYYVADFQLPFAKKKTKNHTSL